jgi:puromycin-sensitive aminopeptidase
MSDEFPESDAVFILAWIGVEGREIAWTWLKENWELIVKRFGTGFILHSFIRGTVTPQCSNEKADEVEEFFESRTHPSFEATLRRSVEQVRIKARWIDYIKQDQLESLIELVKTGLTLN